MNCFVKYDWPGNVRELENCIERLMVVCQSDLITPEYLPKEMLEGISIEKPFELKNEQQYHLNEIEKEIVVKALEKAKWNKSQAAKLLNIDRKALYNRIKKYNIFTPPDSKLA
jgi:two-component system response regulator HydG